MTCRKSLLAIKGQVESGIQRASSWNNPCIGLQRLSKWNDLEYNVDWVWQTSCCSALKCTLAHVSIFTLLLISTFPSLIHLVLLLAGLFLGPTSFSLLYASEFIFLLQQHCPGWGVIYTQQACGLHIIFVLKKSGPKSLTIPVCKKLCHTSLCKAQPWRIFGQVWLLVPGVYLFT